MTLRKNEVDEVAHAFGNLELRTRESIGRAPDQEVKDLMEKQAAMIKAWHAEIITKLRIGQVS